MKAEGLKRIFTEKYSKMDNKTDDKLKEEFLEYKKILEELANALKNNEHLKQEIEENKRLKRMLAHELKNPLNGIGGLLSIIKDNLYSSEEERNSIFDMVGKSVDKMTSLAGILYLDGSSKEELQKKAEILVLEDIAREYAIINNKEMEKEKIGLHFKYNRSHYHKPIEIYANKAIINALWGTLFNNSLAWVPQFSRITQGFRINKADNLEIIMENVSAEKRLRENMGMGGGLGTPFVRDIIKTLGGNFQIYKNISQIKKDYDMDEWWGYKEIRRPEESKMMYGIKITIPMKELTKTDEIK